MKQLKGILIISLRELFGLDLNWFPRSIFVYNCILNILNLNPIAIFDLNLGFGGYKEVVTFIVPYN